MMSGVAEVTQPNSKDAPVTLHYTDGTTETGAYSGDIRTTGNFFSIVSGIQAQRKS
jgi:hypothetical protein